MGRSTGIHSGFHYDRVYSIHVQHYGWDCFRFYFLRTAQHRLRPSAKAPLADGPLHDFVPGSLRCALILESVPNDLLVRYSLMNAHFFADESRAARRPETAAVFRCVDPGEFGAEAKNLRGVVDS